ncbi:HSP20 family protein [Marchantia polymorpha subsp. ruderalis]|uniref:SHSP domain-containing protein n=2 Tax=Marchantia polymorpha TaxID=3197 RepID=A0A176VTA9_MARPO|nr:hypothetical protein AXG93_2402s1130 [Marchantia polymorpha subsp. ruderalis]PTQ39424.1 hypothetical protein MARPO_0045s0083 [Marchantia polymorpha]BBN15464.1 hypothetical protein Mp_6g19800 [Marchantia polymorpha subsp. ruderalis]|eukprot:PTQ39424.1 hypothetical protein MARPO_0045s0083 [Marchantia polymorpha]
MAIFFGGVPMSNALTQWLQTPEEYEKTLHPTAQAFVRDTKAMCNTAVDVKDYPKSYMFVADMPGVKSCDIRVLVENDNVLTIAGERKFEETIEEAKVVRMERSAGTFLRKFTLPADANVDAITAACCEGVLTVTVPKIPPPEQAKPKSIEVSSSQSGGAKAIYPRL